MDYDYEIGRRYLTIDLEKGMSYLTKSTNNGNGDAANDLGLIFKKNTQYKEALKLFRFAHKHGSSIALVNIASLFENGNGVKQNHEIARKYIHKAIKLGNPSAYYALALHYKNGYGVKINHKKEMELLKKGYEIEKKLENCEGDCADQLAFNYLKGIGVRADPNKAFKLWTFAAKKGNTNAKYNVSILKAFNGTTSDIKEMGMRELIDIAINGHFGKARLTLAQLFEEGIRVPKDLKEAGRWYMAGASLREPKCLIKIAQISLEDKYKQYDYKRSYADDAVLDALRIMNSRVEAYNEINKDYQELKEKYWDKLDWEYLETLPERIERKENPQIC